MRRKPTLYLITAITNAPQGYDGVVAQVKKQLSFTFDVLDYYGSASDMQQGKDFHRSREDICKRIYEHDIEHCVAHADLIVVLGDHPTLGGGIEVGAALWRYDKNVLFLGYREKQISALAVGLTIRHPERCEYQVYDHQDEIKDIVRTYAKTQNIL